MSNDSQQPYQQKLRPEFQKSTGKVKPIDLQCVYTEQSLFSSVNNMLNEEKTHKRRFCVTLTGRTAILI